ncbi:MAG: hypothetical protein AAF602_31885 [Myxococcota bacterium]
MADRTSILAVLAERLGARGFRAQPSDDVAACFVRRTWMTNRGVLVLDVPPEVDDPAAWARTQRARCAEAVGFRIPLVYHPGIQIVTLGPPAVTLPEDAVDRIDNQWCVIQAIHVVDLGAGAVQSAATWGQVVSGPDQVAVAAALQAALGGSA